jgi:hypothetical protein
VAHKEELKLQYKFEMEDLTRQKDELLRTLEETREKELAVLRPKIAELEASLVELGEDTTRQREYQKKEEEQLQSYTLRVDEGNKRTDELEGVKLKKRSQFNKIKNEPSRMAKAREQVCLL